MTKTSAVRNPGVKATIELDGIRRAAREIRTLIAPDQRPALNTIMNTMTRELGLGQSYGQALAGNTPSQVAVPAQRYLSFTIEYSGPAWISHLASISSGYTSFKINDSDPEKPIHILRISRLPMTGSTVDADAAAQAFVDAHVLLGRTDVEIHRIHNLDTWLVNPEPPHPDLPEIRDPDGAAFDPYFKQNLPAGLWKIKGVKYYEIPPGRELEDLIAHLKKCDLQEKDGVYSSQYGARYYIPSIDKPATVAITFRYSAISSDPIESFASTDPTEVNRNEHISCELNSSLRRTLGNATLIGSTIFSFNVAPITFRLSPTRNINGRSVPDTARPVLHIDTGIAFSGCTLDDLSCKNRTPEMDAKILNAAGVTVNENEGYTVELQIDNFCSTDNW